MRFTATLLCMLCITVPGRGFAETITLSGTAKHASSLSPLDSVNIELINQTNPSERYSVLTDALGMWSYTFNLTGVGDAALTPDRFSVEQNYPNPFNPSTHIAFSTPVAGTATISVYTVTGQRLDQRSVSLDAGDHSVSWASKGAAGVLFYSISFGGNRITRKMIQLDGHGNGGLGDVVTSGRSAAGVSLAKGAATPFTVVASKFLYMPDSVQATIQGSMVIDMHLETVHEHAFLFDLHNDVMEKAVLGYQLGIRHTAEQSDLPRFRDGGVDAQMFALWTDYRDSISHPYYAYTLAMVDTFQSQIWQNPTELGQARNYDEVMQVREDGRLAGVLAVEGGHAIENDIAKLKSFYNLGARYLTITWNNSLPWAVSASDARSSTVGLSDFGRQVIRTMDTLGMIVDVSHTGIKTIWDILATTRNPIIASHSGVRALNNHSRNLTDVQIDSIAARGGVIGVVFYPTFLSSQRFATIDTVVKHIDYIRNRVGVDYIAIGSDYDGIEIVPVGLEDVSKMPNLTAALLRRGYSIEDVHKILGGNFLRVFKQVCK